MEMNTLTPELVVFDLAGTTVKDNHDVHKVLKATLAQYHVEISLNDANNVMGIPKPVAIEKLLRAQFHPDITPELIDDIHHRFVQNMIAFYKTSGDLRENEGVSHTFEKLRSAGVKVAVDTGFSRDITDALLERMGWLKKNLVNASVTSDEVPQGRPFPDLIFKAMMLCDVNDVSRVAKVGDTESDIQEGHAAKCGWVIGITTGAFSRAQLIIENPTHLIDTIPGVLPIFSV